MSVMAKSIKAIWFVATAFARLGAGAFTVKEKVVLSVSSAAFFAVTVYRVRVLTSVGIPLMVQVVLSILKPAGNVGATVQLAIAPPELLKVIFVMAKSIKAIWFVAKMPQMMIVLVFL
jgi:hypothetical protein